MNLLLALSVLTLGQLELKDGDKQLRISFSDGLTLKTGTKEVTLSGAGAVAKVDGGRAFTGIAQTKTHACVDGEHIDVGGTNNSVTLTGKCGDVTIGGLGQTVSIESAATIDVSGKNNTVTWSKGEPVVTMGGAGNQALKAK